ncbi:MAG: citrate synthase [Deltaproteobacteria bacterium]|nr:citrate synthase [Deltaproteobacteria bacterium]
MGDEKIQVRRRDLKFATRTVTKIWEEVPSAHNPFLAERCRCHGYDLFGLIRTRSFIDVLYLLFRGELPSPEQAQMIESLMIGLINPGPRHPATRAAMNAGVGKTNSVHILPIALSVLGGAYLGGEEVEAAIRFIRQNQSREAALVAEELLATRNNGEGDCHIAPGFGSRFGGIDPVPQELAVLLCSLPACGKALRWGTDFVNALGREGMGWLASGVAACVFCDLGFQPQAGAGLFQLFCAPGLLAHGLELASPYKSIAAMPFLDEEHYVIAPEAKKRNR